MPLNINNIFQEIIKTYKVVNRRLISKGLQKVRSVAQTAKRYLIYLKHLMQYKSMIRRTTFTNLSQIKSRLFTTKLAVLTKIIIDRVAKHF